MCVAALPIGAAGSLATLLTFYGLLGALACDARRPTRPRVLWFLFGWAPLLAAALRALRQAVPDELERDSVQEIWAWAEQHWRDDALAGMTEIADNCNAISRPENGLL